MRALVAALLFALSFAAPAFAQTLLTPSEFRDAAIALIRAADPSAEIEIRDELSIIVRTHNKDRPEFTTNFDSGYAEYQANPAALTDILDRWVRFILTPEHAQMTERIVAVVRPRDMVDGFEREAARARANSALPPSRLVWRPFAGDLVEIIVFDGAESIQYATEESLAELGVTPQRAWELAPVNLPTRMGELEISGVQGADHVAYVSGGNGLAPSSLTEARICGAEANLAFLVVERNGYLFADRSDSVAMRQFGELVGELRRGGQPFSLTPLGCHEGRVVEIVLAD